MKNADISVLFKSLGRIFQRFHTTLFIVIIVAGLSYAVISLSTLLGDASNTTTPTTSPTAQTSTDQATIDRIEALHTSDEAPDNVELPSGRINPFAE